MCDDRIEEKIKDQGIIQRGILLELLRSDHPGRWKRTELRGRLYDATRSAFEKALTILEAEDLIALTETKVWATGSVRHVDELGMISV
jgi:hypothetical protein